MAEGPRVPDVAVVVVTYDALPWIEQCLTSVAGTPTVVVDHGSRDGTVPFVRERFPEVRVLEQENLGLGAGWNRGVRETESRYVLLLNADAWLLGDALERLVAFADAHPRAAVVGPRLRYPDGRLQRSVRGFPTLWRLATEYLFLRKLAPRTQALNAFYAGGFDHDEVRKAEFLMGACLLVRRAAIEEVGGLDEEYFLFSEETDWCYRFRQAGWEVVFFPGAECVHVGGASHGGRMYREILRGHLRFLAKHRGPREAERARKLLLLAMRLRARVFRRERAALARELADWLASGSAADLLER
ncbi:MAG: glycosyl transferase [Gaiellaceae bacterium]|jgi:GT2 family glycosyltransferase|nr:MAG: glycosyl transferase [Gaiellaceae bacterium]